MLRQEGLCPAYALLADMDAQPETLQGNLIPGSPPGPDVTPPVVIARAPAANAANVPVATLVTATFNEPVVAATISFTLRDSGANLVPATVTYSSLTRTATLTPTSALDQNQTYTATLSGAQDLATNPMAAPDIWSFTTTGPPACP